MSRFGKRMIGGIAAMAAVVAVVAPGNAEARAQAARATATTTQVEVIARTGPGSATQTVQAFQRSQWVFYDNGAVTLSPNPQFFRSDLIPLIGTYTVRSGVISFDVSRQIRIGNTGSAVVRMTGTMRAGRNGTVVGEALLQASAGNGSVVNGTVFSGAQAKVERLQFTVA